jgi:hypothetical protein
MIRKLFLVPLVALALSGCDYFRTAEFDVQVSVEGLPACDVIIVRINGKPQNLPLTAEESDRLYEDVRILTESGSITGPERAQVNVTLYSFWLNVGSRVKSRRYENDRTMVFDFNYHQTFRDYYTPEQKEYGVCSSADP